MRPPPAKPPLLALLILLAAPLAQALPSDREQVIHVSANSARYNEKTGIATYTGAVVIRQGTLEIRADEIVITTDPKGNILTTVARGNPAHYQQQPEPGRGLVTAQAARIDYDARREVITLNGKARLRQEGSSFQGSVITYDSQSQQVDARGQGSERVQLVFPPQARPPRDKEKPN